MTRTPLTVEALAAALSPEARQRLAAIQRDARAREALQGKAPRAAGPAAPSTAPRGAPCAPSVLARGLVVALTLKGLRLVSAANSREHWTSRADRSRDTRGVVAEALREHPAPPGPWVVAITRSGPQALDTDNLAGSAKALRDAVATWLGVDDGPSAPVRWEYGQTRGGYGATVVVRGTAPRG